jgi:hypothetical protein
MLIDYRWLQSAAALRKLERQNFLEKKARMQWWYVDILMNDGSVLLVAFVPKKWWLDTVDASLDDAFLFVTMVSGADRTSRSVSKTLDASRLRSAERGLGLEIPGALTIARDAGDPATYRFTFDVPEIQGWLEVRSQARPFSAFPRGTLPALGRAVLLGGRLGTEAFSYVTQVPRGTVSGTLTMGGERIVVDGHAYHEQGRFDDAPARLSKGWFWCHFLHPEWNVFGSPGVFLYVQQRQDRPIFAGFNLFDRSLGLKNRTMAGEPPHPPVFSGGEMRFGYRGLRLSITADPKRNMPLISFPSATTRQIFHTLVTDAELTVERTGTVNSFAGQMILETCWVGL